jgi:hypothetical protein
MEKEGSRVTYFLRSLVHAKAIIFGVAVLNFLAVVTQLVQYKRQFPVPSDHWNPAAIMQEPFLLLLASALLFVSKGWGYLLALALSGRVIYVLGYLGLVAIAGGYDYRLLNWQVLKTWLVFTYQAQPQYLLELAIAATILTYVLILYSRRIRTGRKF